MPGIYTTDFVIGQEVYLKTDVDQKKRLIVAISISCDNHVSYKVVCGTNEYWALSIELSLERNAVMANTTQDESED